MLGYLSCRRLRYPRFSPLVLLWQLVTLEKSAEEMFSLAFDDGKNEEEGVQGCPFRTPVAAFQINRLDELSHRVGP